MKDEIYFLEYIKPMIRGLKQDQLYNTDEQVDIVLEIINRRLKKITK